MIKLKTVFVCFLSLGLLQPTWAAGKPAPRKTARVGHAKSAKTQKPRKNHPKAQFAGTVISPQELNAAFNELMKSF